MEVHILNLIIMNQIMVATNGLFYVTLKVLLDAIMEMIQAF